MLLHFVAYILTVGILNSNVFWVKGITAQFFVVGYNTIDQLGETIVFTPFTYVHYLRYYTAYVQ